MKPDLLPWYESSLPVQERRKRGHFSTPPLLVEHILDACGYTSDNDLSAIRVLDPACGSGNFLVAAAQRLIVSSQHTNLPQKTLLDHLHRNLWGFDPDPVACYLAETNLRTTISANSYIQRRVPHLHIHQADGLAFPWQQQASIDLFLANPPYLAAKNTDLSPYRSSQQDGQLDSYLFFVELALQIVRPGGWIGLILPDPVLARMNATYTRKRLLSETTIHHLWHLSNVFTAYVGAVVLVAQKCPPPLHHEIQWCRERWHHTPASPSISTPSRNTVSQALLRNQPHAELCYLLGNEHSTLIHQIHSHVHQTQTSVVSQRTFAFLKEYLTISRGEEMGKQSPLLSTDPLASEHYYPVLRGGIDIHPYKKPLPVCSIAASNISKPLVRYLSPKLVIVKSMNRLCTTLDLDGCVVLQTLYMLHLRTPAQPDLSPHSISSTKTTCDDLYFFLSLLNSRFLNEYIFTLYTAYKWVQPQIEQHVLAHLPIPLHVDPAIKQGIISRAQQLSTLTSSSHHDHYQKLLNAQEQDIHNLFTAAIGEDA